MGGARKPVRNKKIFKKIVQDDKLSFTSVGGAPGFLQVRGAGAYYICALGHTTQPAVPGVRVKDLCARVGHGSE